MRTIPTFRAWQTQLAMKTVGEQVEGFFVEPIESELVDPIALHDVAEQQATEISDFKLFLEGKIRGNLVSS